MKFWNVPNTLGVLRVFFIIAAIPLMYYVPTLWWIAVILILSSFALDGLDGYLARKLDQTTTLGSLVDVLADRITEYMLWVFYTGMGAIPLWAPLIVIPRGVITDAIRAIANAKGISVYELPQSGIAKALIKNRVPRLLIGFLKAVLFTTAAVYLASTQNICCFEMKQVLNTWIFWLTVLVVVLNIARGLPVILEADTVIE